MLTVVTWLWKSTGWRNCYTAQHVNTLQTMLYYNLTIPHRMVCITDMPEGIKCETIPLWDEPKIKFPRSPRFRNRPNCYKRLKAFSKEMIDLLGPRILSIDLDCVITGTIDPLIEREEDFVILQGNCAPYNGSMWLLNTGSKSEVWEDFDPKISPDFTYGLVMENGKNYFGSDQAWISYKIPNAPLWTKEDGIYQYWNEKKLFKHLEKPKIIFFAGSINPWDSKMLYKDRQLHKLYKHYEEVSCRNI